VAEERVEAIAKLFKDRKKLIEDPERAVSDAGGPPELGAFLAGLSRGERHILADTWDHMIEQGFTADFRGVTVAFL
jgi:hypothetical protein